MQKFKSTKSTKSTKVQKVQKYKSTKVQKNELKVWTLHFALVFLIKMIGENVTSKLIPY